MSEKNGNNTGQDLREAATAPYGYANGSEWKPDPDKQGHYTVDDLEALPDDVKAELIDGTIYLMSAPRSVHQKMLAKLCYYFEDFIQKNGGLCMVEPGVGVRVDDDNRTEMIPDLSIICDPSKDDNKRIHGAPDLVIEILSPSTRSYDLKTKFSKYISSGVRECWMVDIDRHKVIICDNTDPDSPDFKIYGLHDKVPVAIYNGDLEIDFGRICMSLGLFEKQED